MKSKLFGRFFTVLMILCVLTSLVAVCMGAEQESGIGNDLLRLHVIANSNSDFDQALKLKVRDAVLSAAEEITHKASSAQDAKAQIKVNLHIIEAAAKECLEKNGCSLSVKASVERCAFPTKNYGVFALPAGSYEALRVFIGDAQGQNWWCVLFPPLCNAATEEEFVEAAVKAGISSEDIALMSGKRVFKFRLAELFAYIRQLLTEA